MHKIATWPDLAKASLFGVIAAWIAYAILAGIDVVTGSSRDIAMALYPAVTMIALAVAIILFWPLTIGMARLGTSLGVTRPWARSRWVWAAIGAVTGALTLILFMGVLSNWSAENVLVTTMGIATGSVSSLVTRWRLGVGRVT